MEQSPVIQKKILTQIKHKNLKENNYDNIKINLYKHLPFFSYKILEAKYSSTPELYQQIILNNLITRKKTHFFAYLNEISINTNIFKELLKRYYINNESRERIPKYVSYYQNYLKFFCRPVFGDYITNKKMVKHMEKVAQIFYNENYADEDELEQSKSHMKFNFKIFNKTAREEIEKYGDYTKVNSTENNNCFELNYNHKKNNDIKSRTIDINKRFHFKNNDLDLLESIYKITPILDSYKIKKYKKNKYDSLKEEENSRNSEYNSLQKILREMTNKKKSKIKESTNKKANKLSSHKNIFDYFNSLSSILFGRKKKTSSHKNNSVNNKYNKKKDKNSYNSNNNKIINNINININHLTIGQKPLNPLSENNNYNYKKGKKKKTNSKTRKHNSMIIRYKSFKNSLNFFGNLTSKNLEYKKRNDSFKLSTPINPILGYNSNKLRKNSNMTSNSNISNISNTRNKSNLKGGNICRINNGCSTSLNKYKKNNLKQFEKMMIYTNNINYTKNMFNILDINSNSKKIKHINNNNSNSINFNSYNNHNKMINSLHKNPSRAYTPLFWRKKHKNNINTNKGTTMISYERVRSTTNKSKKQKKIFSPKFNSSAGNINIINDSHFFVTPKNLLINNNISKFKMNRNENSHNSHEKRDIGSPIYRENFPLVNRNNLILKKKNKEDQKYGYSKAINLKIKNYVKLTNLKKNLKMFPKQIANKSKGKKNINKKK